MAGIYIHIPFCKQACHYCNFHFVTSLRNKNELMQALLKETELQKAYLEDEPVETIYFGGGTPSLLEGTDLELQIAKIKDVFSIAEAPEVTVEVNPDDITEQKLEEWQSAGINRLSIGVQSFFDEDLVWMNRAHSASQAVNSLQLAVSQFSNLSADLIYGTPMLSNEKWKENVDRMIGFDIPHLSCYALTVEPKTPLQKLILEKRSPGIDPEKQSEQFMLLMQWLREAGYEQYEISNFAKPGFRSRHNSSYWHGKKYLGLGPSAHSFDGTTRQWNVANNSVYITSIQIGKVPFEKEVLTQTQRLNEYIMTSLRTSEGLSLLKTDEMTRERLMATSRKYIENNLMKFENNSLVLTEEGKLLADGISANLFA